MKYKQAFLTAPGHFEIREVDNEPAENQILVKIASCGLCNWELNHWKGYIVKPGGTLGHEWAGTVTKVGSAVTKFKVGDYGVIIGCGPMGQWCVQGLAGNLLAGLIVVDIDDAKLEMAKSYGATHTINSKREDVVERICEITRGHMADFVIEGTGRHSMLNIAMDYLKRGRGRLIVMSAYEETSPDFDFRKAVALSVDIHVAHPGHSLNPMDDMRRACELIANGTFRVKELISHEYPLSEIHRAFEELEHKPAGFLKGLVYPD